MAKFVIQGGVPLSGQIDVEANKNAVLPMMAAALLTDDDVFLDNVPGIVDVDTMSTILSELGAEVERLNCHTLRLNCSGVTGFNIYSMVVAVIGAIVVLVIYHAVVGRRAY